MINKNALILTISAIYTVLSSIVGGWVTATIAVSKTNTKLLCLFFCLVLIFIANLTLMGFIFWVAANTFHGIIRTISTQPSSSQTTVASVVAVLGLLVLFLPILSFATTLANQIVPIMLQVSSGEKAAELFRQEIEDRQQRWYLPWKK